MAKATDKRKLTQALADTLRPGKERLIWDALIPGLHIRIRPRSMTWRLVKRFGDGAERKQRYWDLGEVGRTSEAVARERANEAIKLIDRGMDPESYLSNAQRGGVHVDEAGWSFGVMLDTYVASKAPEHPDDPSNSFREYRSAFKLLDREHGLEGLKELDLRSRPAAEITEYEIEHIRDTYGRIAPSRAVKLVSYISQAYRYAIKNKGKSKVLQNPAKYVGREVAPSVLASLAPEVSERRERRQERRGISRDDGRSLTVRELRHYISAITYMDGLTVPVRMALMMSLLVPNRKGPWLMSEWTWIRHNHQHGWHIVFPWRTMKAKRDHAIPLAAPALTVAQYMAAYAQESGSKWLFPSVRKLRKGVIGDPHVDGTSLNNAIERMIAPKPELAPHDPSRRGRGIRREPLEPRPGYLYERGVTKLFSPHDLRRTFTTLLAERGTSEFYSGLVLAHTLPIADGQGNLRSNITRKHYNIYNYYAEKKVAIDAWTRLLEQECGLDINLLIPPPVEIVVGMEELPSVHDFSHDELEEERQR